MNQDTKTALFSGAGLIATIFIAWYFSRKRVNVSVTAAPATETPATSSGSGSTYTFNQAPVSVPGLTLPNFPAPVAPPTSTPVTSSCCKRCEGPNDHGGGKVLTSGNFAAAVYGATSAALTNNTVNTATVSTTGKPTGVILIAQSNGGMPLPSPSWWNNDPIYRQAYVLAYNQVLNRLGGQSNQTLLQGGGSVSISGYVRSLPPDAANYDYGSVAGTVTQQGETQASAGAAQETEFGHHAGAQWTLKQRTNSIQYFQFMMTALPAMMQNLGDPYADQINGMETIGAPQQQNLTIQ